MISGNYYKITTYLKGANRDVVVRMKYTLPLKIGTSQSARAEVIWGEFKGDMIEFRMKDVLMRFGQLKEFKKNFAEYWI